jgi:hypothetical protein
VEILVPLVVPQGAGDGWERGLGDVAVALKHAAYHSLERWAQNLRPYDAAETRRCVSWFEAMSSGSAVVLAQTSAFMSPRP